jgi:transketolase
MPIESALQSECCVIRKNILQMVYRAQSSHIGSCYSCIEILTALYFKILRIDPKNPWLKTRDRFILSKGHAAAALYAVLAHRGFFPSKKLTSYGTDGTYLAGHPVAKKIPGVEFSTGSLGHGLGAGAGLALAAKNDRKEYRVFVLLSDGECDEGALWETALFASHHKLDKLTAIIDYNKLQAYGFTNQVLNLEPLADKWRAFGWVVKSVDGHNLPDLIKVLQKIPFTPKKPSLIIAHTIKGKGVSFMENDIFWHYHSPDEKEYQKALSELNSK